MKAEVKITVCKVTLRMWSDLTFAMAARALVDIFNGQDNATERRRGTNKPSTFTAPNRL